MQPPSYFLAGSVPWLEDFSVVVVGVVLLVCIIVGIVLMLGQKSIS